jgi:hypothetical protein
MSKLGKFITPAIGGVSFVSQLTAKDITNYGGSNYQALANVEKAKFLGNAIASRTTGFSPYPQYGTPGFTINPAGTLNKFTGAGVLLLVASEVAPSGFGKANIKRVGKGLLLGGIFGGLFDAPKQAGQTQQQQQAYSNSLARLNTSSVRGAL